MAILALGIFFFDCMDVAQCGHPLQFASRLRSVSLQTVLTLPPVDVINGSQSQALAGMGWLGLAWIGSAGGHLHRVGAITHANG